LLWA